jgi:FkbM family methyltransferase
MHLEEMRALGLIETRDCRHGRLSFLRTDQYIAQSLGYYGEFSESEINVWRTLVRPGDTVVSAGANIGAHIVFFAKQVGPSGRVITMEPQQPLYEILRENLTQNGLDNVEAAHGALGKVPGTTCLPVVDYRYCFSFGSLFTGDAENMKAVTRTVRMATIDELVGDRRVRLIQLDVEGNEAGALQGALKTIEASRPYLYLECDQEAQRPQVLELLAALDYEPLMHYAPLWNPRNFAGNRLNVFANTVSISILGVPKGGV